MQIGKDLIKALNQIEVEKGLPTEIIVSSLEAAMASAYKKYKNGGQVVEVHIDNSSGEISIEEKYHIVKEVTNPDCEWTLEQARGSGNELIDIDGYVYVEVNPENFGRSASFNR